MKKILVIVAMLMMIVPVALFAQAQAESDVVKIGAAMNSFSDKWQTYLQDAIREFDAEMDDVEVLMTDGKDDPAVQLSQVETLLTKGIDALVIVPVDISALGPIVTQCKNAGVKIVVVNRLPEEKYLSQIDVYAGSDSIDAGIMQAEWVAEKLGAAGGKVGIMMGTSGQEAAAMRTKGNEEVFAKYPNIEIVAMAEGKWDRAKGMAIAENWLQAYPDLKAIVCNNDEMAIGALLAAQSIGIKDADIIIAGVDATKDALEYVGKGLDVTVFQSPMGQGRGGVEAAYKLVKGQPVEKMTWIPFELVTPENKANY